MDRALESLKRGDILVTVDTDNKWDNAFTRISGVITDKGGWTSHAAVTSRERHKPCLVATQDATNLLRQYAGRTVTFDPYKKSVYLTNRPATMTIEIEPEIWRPLQELLSNMPNPLPSIWRTRRDFVNGYRWADNFMEDFEGAYRGRPKTPFGYLELDYYSKGFDRYAENLNRLFPERRFSAMQRKFKHRIVYTYLPEEVDGLHNELYQLSVDDFDRILQARVAAFEETDNFFSGLRELDGANIARTMDHLVELLSWMHIARPFYLIFNQKYAKPQERFISDKILTYQKLQLELAALQRVPGQVHWPTKLTHWEKAKETAAIEETIRMDEEARQVLVNEPAALPSRKPELYGRIVDFAKKWKLTDEDIRKGDDIKGFMEFFRGNAQAGMGASETISSQQLLRLLDKWHLADADLLNKIQAADHDLYLTIRLYAKTLQAQSPDNAAKDEKEMMARAVDKLRQEKAEEKKVIEAFKVVLGEYPTMARIISINTQEFSFMEDAHQLISRYQKQLHYLLLDAARKHPEVFGDNPEGIFDLSTDEVVALFHERSAGYLKKTFERHKVTEAADERLEQKWSVDRADALRDYERDAEDIKSILRDQRKEAGDKGVKSYYEKGIKNIDERIGRLHKLAEGPSDEDKNSGDLALADNDPNRLGPPAAAAPPAAPQTQGLKAAQAETDRIHIENRNKYTQVISKVIPEKTILCHIVTDSILPLGQRQILQDLEKEMADNKYTEKVVQLKIKGPSEFADKLQELMDEKKKEYEEQGYKVQFDVACPSTQLVGEALRLGVTALAFKPCEETEIAAVQVEGIILALRALDLDAKAGKIVALREAFKFLTGQELPQELSTITDVNEFIKKTLFTLPINRVDYNDIEKLNRLIRENIESAA